MAFLYQTGHANQAMEYFTEAIKWNPSVPQYFLNRGDCYHRLRKHERALLDYKHVLDLDSGNQEALAKLGGLHNEWGAILFNKGEVGPPRVGLCLKGRGLGGASGSGQAGGWRRLPKPLRAVTVG